MTSLAREEVDAIREAIESYRAAVRENYASQYSHDGVLSAAITGEDTPEAWRSYETDKKVDKAEWKLIRLLEAYVGVIESVRCQGILYSVRKGKRWNERI